MPNTMPSLSPDAWAAIKSIRSRVRVLALGPGLNRKDKRDRARLWLRQQRKATHGQSRFVKPVAVPKEPGFYERMQLSPELLLAYIDGRIHRRMELAAARTRRKRDRASR